MTIHIEAKLTLVSLVHRLALFHESPRRLAMIVGIHRQHFESDRGIQNHVELLLDELVHGEGTGHAERVVWEDRVAIADNVHIEKPAHKKPAHSAFQQGGPVHSGDV